MTQTAANKKTKIITVVGTRPEIIRLSRVIYKLNESLEHILIHTGQNYDYELNEVFFQDLGIRKPDYFLASAGKSAAETIGNIISKIDPILEKENPDGFLVLGDTNSCLAAITAKRRKIPIFHMEAGNRCFDFRVPEEINRRIVDHVSDINLPYSDIAREYLLKENIPPDRIIKTGSPMFEVLAHHQKEIDQSNILDSLKLKKQEYFVVSAHREENIDSTNQFKLLCHSLNEIAKKYPFPIIFSTHPRTKKKIAEQEIQFHSRIQLLNPFGFLDFIQLQKNSFAVLSDSGTISEESSILNFPALNLRYAHERPEAMEEGAVIMTGLESSRILESLEIVTQQPRGVHRTFQLVKDYSSPNVSDKVLRIILSYCNYVNRVVWSK